MHNEMLHDLCFECVDLKMPNITEVIYSYLLVDE